ncbi:B12-binding domain-containing radical SAM protein [Plantactinospora sp. DSM 117369]
MVKVLLAGEVFAHRSFNGANKALPVLASSLHNAGFDSIQLDLERPDVSFDDLCREAVDADLIAFAGVLTPQWPELDVHLMALRDHLARIGRSHVPVVVGGYATKGVQDIAVRTPWVTAFFNGEGEHAIVDLARWAARGAPSAEMAEIDGMCYIDGTGRFRFSIAARVADLDHIDQNFEFVHVPEVHDMPIFRAPDGRQLKTGQMYTQRGCPWACSFCNKSTEGNKVARLGKDRLRAQLRAMRADGYEAVYLDVDTFNVNRSAALDDASVLADEGFVWGSNTRIDTADTDFIRGLVENNCVYMFFGVEHTALGVLIAIDKFNGSLPAQLRRIAEYRSTVQRVFRDMGRFGLPSSYFLILGLPTAVLSEDGTMVVGYRPTRFEDDVEAIAFGLEQCEPDYLNFNMLRFMPGSAAADIPNHAAYSCVRPSGAKPITAGYFLPRVARDCGYVVPENHGVYRLCESVGHNQPTTTAVDPERVYDSIQYAVDLINKRVAAGFRPTQLFVDQEAQDAGLLTRDEDGTYRLAPLKEFEGL